MRHGSGGGAPGAKSVHILVSNSVTGDALFAGNGQKSACRHAANWWPRGGGPLSRLFFYFILLLCVCFPIPSTALHTLRRHHGHHDLTMKRVDTHSYLCESGKSGYEEQPYWHLLSLGLLPPSVVLCEEAPEKDICAGSFHM